MMPEKGEQDDHRNGHAKEPQKYAAAKSHVYSPFFMFATLALNASTTPNTRLCPYTFGRSVSSCLR